MYNYDLIEKIVQRIENLSPNEEFNMTHYYVESWPLKKSLRSGEFHCGTSACIAGWALILDDSGLSEKDLSSKMQADVNPFYDAKALLGFSHEEATFLFIDVARSYENPEEIAIYVLKELLEDKSKTVLEIAEDL